MEHARVTVYEDFTQSLVERFDRIKPEALPIETFSNINEEVYEKQKEDVNTVTLGEEQLPPPIAAVEVLTSVRGSKLAYLQYGPKHLTLRVC